MSISTSQRLFIVTGASRGLGAALARRLLAPGHTLLCLSRHTDDSLTRAADGNGATVEQWPADLADPVPVAERVGAWLSAFAADRFAAATLINNAGVLTRIGALERCTSEELSAALRAGLEAPLVLCAAFLRATAEWPADRRVLNISSGLGRRAMAGQATYCAAKAGMDHLSRALALDQAELAHGARVVSLAPGVIDTDMQVQLRAADGSGFPDQANFVRLKESGQLASADATAERVLAYLARADFGTIPVADVRDA
jgi:NAD(P)-dependent dehydrogenase (short-subunit alcohol dehydrogenase family)